MVKRPTDVLNNPQGKWLGFELLDVQRKKPFLIITSMIYICNKVTPNHQIKSKIVELLLEDPQLPIYKLGFLNNWQDHPIWK
jgi:abortive infection bacteriophage resistance protein